MVLLAAGGTAAAIKLSQRDAQRIEEHTGLPPEQLEDQDLEQAMQELNIQSQPLSSEDQEILAQQNDTSTVQGNSSQMAATAESAPMGGNQIDYLAELEKLGDLRDRGIITEQDFEAKKRQILGI